MAPKFMAAGGHCQKKHQQHERIQLMIITSWMLPFQVSS
jgi:hypothetical protein